jgi:vacuolar iron transporter family protein
LLAPQGAIAKPVPAAELVFLAALGTCAGGAPMVKPALRVDFWTALAMAVTAAIGAMIGKAV